MRDEDPDESDMDDDDDPEMVPCPYCGEEISEDAEMCARCGNYISREDAGRPRRATWIIVTVILLLIATLLTYSFT